MAAYTAYDVVGIKEDISDIISNISPTYTPFQSVIGSETVHNTLFQWQEDALAAVNLNNKNVQGADATETAPVATSLKSNYTQILMKALKVADTTDATSRYGRAKETAYQLGKYSKEVKRDLEAILLSWQVAAAGDNTSTPAQMHGFKQQVYQGAVVNTGGVGIAMSEANLLSALSTTYTAGAEPSLLMIPPGEGTTVANFAAASGRTRDLEDMKKVVNAVDLYVSPYGEVKVILNRFANTRTHYVFNPDDWKLAVLRPWTRETLAKTGDATKMMIVGEFSLKHLNSNASSLIIKQ